PIRLKEGHTIQRETGEGGITAITHYKAIKTLYNHTYLEFSLETGRTHQIRVHMASIGHPLAGDDMYGGSRKYFNRQCLHCSEIRFTHPITNQIITIRKEPQNWFEILQKNFQN
ncbi:MAG: RNA pseudouridine synthase, partial [Clostridia bacterium]|nr:RNA pseudouridine synthase [Clostridia bacterium]